MVIGMYPLTLTANCQEEKAAAIKVTEVFQSGAAKSRGVASGAPVMPYTKL